MHILLDQVELKAPETSQYLRLVIQLLEARLREIEGDVSASKPVPVENPRVTANPNNGAGEGLERAEEKQKPSERTGRWFVTRLPRITLARGEQVTVRSLEHLRELIQRHDLAPHPRGDASMLLWQVKTRLKFPVQAVPLEGE